jgi:hypothetical protein
MSVEKNTKLREMLQTAADSHRTLCLGQGAELSWARTPQERFHFLPRNNVKKIRSSHFSLVRKIGSGLRSLHESSPRAFSAEHTRKKHPSGAFFVYAPNMGGCS